VFEGAGACLSCHRVNHVGSYLGPDLSEIGGVRSAATLEDTLMDPVSGARPGNRSIRAVKKNGEVVTGRRLNEDTWSVQIMDSRERLVSLWKPDLKEYTVIPSTMPSYKDKLSAADRADVIAYLLSLKPAPSAGAGGRGAGAGTGAGAGRGRGAAQ
jgi:putative heme-binding domain-containing protein